MKKVSTISISCTQCKGRCWVSDNQTKTQENVRKHFGSIPNSCINDSNGKVHCPAVLGLL